MAKQRIISIDKIIFDVMLYPRNEVSKDIVKKYKEEMQQGAKFPPVTIGYYNEKYYLVDGWHRVKALKELGNDSVESIVNEYSTERDLYIDAVKFNIAHGKPLEYSEKRNIILKLEKMQVSQAEISSILFISSIRVSNMCKSTNVIMPNAQYDFSVDSPEKCERIENDRYVIHNTDQYILITLANTLQLLKRFKLENREITERQNVLLLKIKEIIDEMVGKIKCEINEDEVKNEV